MHLTQSEEGRLNNLLLPYISTEYVQKLRQFIQHGSVTTYDHCQSVAQVSFYLNRRLHLGCDEYTLVGGAMLHDFYFYDWHDGQPCRKYHGFTHPEEARKNAVKYFNATPAQQHIIRCHMWPFTLLHLPHTREAVVVCIADKYCSTRETLFMR